MKQAVNISRVLVGGLFVISGLVKANDPLGLSYKMQEFFDVWATDLTASSFFFKNALFRFFSFLNAHSLALSLVMITLEIMAGVALLIGWRKKAVVFLLLPLILFFTFLTGYAFASGKFKNCGCFGDCLPITPLASFLKDIVLLLLILMLSFFKQYIQPVFAAPTRIFILGFSFIFSLLLQWYVLNFLPLADCLPFKKNASITEGLKPPPHAVPDSFAIQFVYEKGGQRYEFFPENLPADLATYTFIERKDRLIRKGNAEPAIKGFTLSGDSNIDSASFVLTQPHALLYFYETASRVSSAVKKDILQLYKEAALKNIPVFVITTSLTNLQYAFATDTLPGLYFFKVDFTAFRTAARTNPCIYLLQNGTIKDKRSMLQSNTIRSAIQKIK